MIGLPRIASRAFDTPLLIDPAKAEAIALGLGARMLGGAIEFVGGIGVIEHDAAPKLGTVGNLLGRAFAANNARPYALIDSVAIIPVEGTLVHKGGYVGSSSGETSYEGLQTQVAAALRADDVKGVVFEVDSYGGEAAGAFETADMIAKLSAAKPTLAILNEVGLSAGYLMASAARQIVAPEFGRAGSIGVLMMHIDRSRQLANDGIKVTLVTAGKRKAEGSPTEALSDETRARMQAMADRMWNAFADRIGTYRTSRLSAAAALATEAGVFDAPEALSLGLIDGIGTAEAAFAAFIHMINDRR